MLVLVDRGKGVLWLLDAGTVAVTSVLHTPSPPSAALKHVINDACLVLALGQHCCTDSAFRLGTVQCRVCTYGM